jgi:hypothetical protein
MKILIFFDTLDFHIHIKGGGDLNGGKAKIIEFVGGVLFWSPDVCPFVSVMVVDLSLNDDLIQCD